MKKIVLVLVVMLAFAAPSMAGVTITAIDEGNGWVRIKYNKATGGDLIPVVAWALTVDVNVGVIDQISDFNRGQSVTGNKGYGIFPDNFSTYIDPNDPNWNHPSYTPVAPAGAPGAPTALGSNSIVIELGTLYETPNEPPDIGTLCRVHVTQTPCTLDVNTEETFRKGVVTVDGAILTGGDLDLSGAQDVNVSGTATISGTVSGDVADGVTISGLPGPPVTSGGSYSATVSTPFTGTATPTLAGYTFAPPERTYSAITTDQTNQDYTSTAITPSISGTVSGDVADGVTMSGLPGNPVTAGGGNYSATVAYNWSGTVTPTLAGYTFAPPSRTYSNVTSDLTGEDYTSTAVTPTISGTVSTNPGLGGVTMSGLPGNPQTSGDGTYSGTVSYNWSGTVTPTKLGYDFSPPEKTYSNVTSDQSGEDYTAIEHCFDTGHPDYNEWLAWDKPKCWCYTYHCWGDAEGKGVPSGKLYPKHRVGGADLTIVLQSWKKYDGSGVGDPDPAHNICGDVSRSGVASGKLYPAHRVGGADLTIVLQNWKNNTNLTNNCGGELWDPNDPLGGSL